MTACYSTIKTTLHGHLSGCIFVCFVLGAAALLCPSASAAIATGQTECSNQLLRPELNSSSLPDCRAYEMVSPPYKEGYPLFVSSYASDGERVILNSLATLTDTPGSTETLKESGLYLNTRTTDGWRLSALNPPSSEFVGQIPVATEADDGDTLWEQHTPTQSAATRELYVRSSDDVFNRIGPLNPLASSAEESSNIMRGEASSDHVVGATDNYGHVVLEAASAQARWGIDSTEGNETHSLYEYSGTDNAEPILVGVIGGKGSRQLIGKCGTTLGAGVAEGSLDSYNAISRDGEVIFFTVAPCEGAPVSAELYARLHGALASASAAEAVDVSASECTKNCGVHESGKDFEGASEDGERVFFTSTQKLTDNAVDGAESGDATGRRGCAATEAGAGGCNLYLFDFGDPVGARLKAVSVGGEVLGVAGVAEDGSRVYFVSRVAIGSATKNPNGQAPVGGEPNLYVYDVVNASTAFIATLSSEEESEDRLDWATVNRRPVEVLGESGGSMLFASTEAGITPDDKSSRPHLFEYKAEQDGEPAELVRVSKGENGFNEDGNGTAGVLVEAIASIAGRTNTDFKSTTNQLNGSVDGRTVFFLTTGQLSSRATSAGEGCTSLYEFHTEGALAGGSVHLVSDGRDVQSFKGAFCGAQFERMDQVGANVMFATDDALLPTDVDGVQQDIYDARVNGGFGPSPAVGLCDMALCAEVAGVAPSLPVATSESRNGESPLPSVVSGIVSKKSRGLGKAVSRKKGDKLARALRACRRKQSRSHRTACQRAARRRFGRLDDKVSVSNLSGGAR